MGCPTCSNRLIWLDMSQGSDGDCLAGVLETLYLNCEARFMDTTHTLVTGYLDMDALRFDVGQQQKPTVEVQDSFFKIILPDTKKTTAKKK